MAIDFLAEHIRGVVEKKGIAHILYLVAGYPSQEVFLENIYQLATSGADCIEIGIPFSDPVVESPAVMDASLEALQKGVSLASTLSLLAKGGALAVPTVIVGYYNTFLSYGLASFAKDAAAAGVKGCLVHDLPLEESSIMRGLLKKEGIALVASLGINTPLDRMRAYARVGQGYVSMIPLAEEGADKSMLLARDEKLLAEAQSIFSIPLAVRSSVPSLKQTEGFSPLSKVYTLERAFTEHLNKGGSGNDFFAL